MKWFAQDDAFYEGIRSAVHRNVAIQIEIGDFEGWFVPPALMDQISRLLLQAGHQVKMSAETS